MGKIVAVCRSAKKGERKKDIGIGRLIKDLGLEGDGHAGFMHRQISLLAIESIAKMQAKGLKVGAGDFAENLTTEGLDLLTLPVGTRLGVGTEAILRVTQIGKECHHHCAIYEQAGDCVMPREGIFTEVLRDGPVANGDSIRVLPGYRFGVLTASDKGSRGEREDKSGPLIGELLKPWGDAVAYRMVPDEPEELIAALQDLTDREQLDLIVTTGGTGFSPRDRTPEATLAVVDRLVPGIPEAMRAAGLQKTPKAMLSRGVAGIRGRCLIINLPGSPRGVRENLEVLFPLLEHGLEIVTGRGGECG
jgi:molybdopterin adenylyltransferase